MTTLKTMNDVNALYDAGMTKLKNGLLLCPVCGKTYKTEAPAKKHIEARSCHRMQDIIKDTMHEAKAYGMYKILISSLQPNARVTLNSFRKSPMYSPVARFTMYCSLHEVFSCDTYMAWLNEIKGIQNVNVLLQQALLDENLREFRIFAHVHDLIPSEHFYQAYRDDLISDDEFFIRSLERAKVGVRFILKQDDFPFEERCAKLPLDYAMRLERLLEEVLRDPK
jgi:hypothetical protein